MTRTEIRSSFSKEKSSKMAIKTEIKLKANKSKKAKKKKKKVKIQNDGHLLLCSYYYLGQVLRLVKKLTRTRPLMWLLISIAQLG